MKTSLFHNITLLSTLFIVASLAAQSASFTTTLGKDTLVVEQFTIQPVKVEAEVLIRTPRTEYSRQTLYLEPDGSFREFESSTFNAGLLSGPAIAEQKITVMGDSLVITNRSNSETSRIALAYEPSLLPWIDMVHWPYEVATRQMVNKGEQERDQKMLAGRGPAVFEIRKLAPDSVSIKHPFRGTMYASLNKQGGLVYYDATETTRKLIVKRAGPVDMKALAKKYADMPIGSLSGEGETEATISGAGLTFTFGQPARRGRELFGGIVPWNERWRTGANRATHFKTNKNLKFKGLEVPAGEYTLFTIPQPHGGTLIINTETGQNGNSYDANRDLGRVAMTLTNNDTNVELFTIDAIERGDKGIMQLKWGTTVFEVPFEVAD